MPAGSAIDIFTKDLASSATWAARRNFPLPVAATALQMFLMTAAAGMGRDDDASVARMIAQMTDIEAPDSPADAASAGHARLIGLHAHGCSLPRSG